MVGTVAAAGNRRAPVSGLYDWSKAGYRGGRKLPGQNEINPSAACQITAAELASQSTKFGFNASGNGLPAGCTVNGNSCGGN